jgi:hypothetical protein
MHDDWNEFNPDTIFLPCRGTQSRIEHAWQRLIAAVQKAASDASSAL